MRGRDDRERSAPLTLVTVGLGLLSVYGLCALGAMYFLNLPQPTKDLLDNYDDLICYLFIVDFFAMLWRAPSKLAFLKWGWIDLVSSLPMFNILRIGRVFYIVKVVRGMLAFPSPGKLVEHLYKNRAQAVFATVLLLAMMLAAASSILILQAEEGTPGSNIETPEDAVWWSWVTLCTVGYGDKYPVTTDGRIIAAALMTAGITLFGTLAGLLSSWFMRAILQVEEREVERLKKEVHLLRKRLEELESRGPSSG